MSSSMLVSVYLLPRLCGRRRRQPDAEDGTAARVLVDVNLTAVRFDGPFRDGQAETGSTVLAGACLVEPEEAVEDPLAVGRRHTRALIGDLEDGLVAVDPNANPNHRSGRA